MFRHELSTLYTREEIVEIVKMIRLHFYNRPSLWRPDYQERNGE